MTAWIRETVVQYRGDAQRGGRIACSADAARMIEATGLCGPHDLVESFVVVSPAKTSTRARSTVAALPLPSSPAG